MLESYKQALLKFGVFGLFLVWRNEYLDKQVLSFFPQEGAHKVVREAYGCGVLVEVNDLQSSRPHHLLQASDRRIAWQQLEDKVAFSPFLGVIDLHGLWQQRSSNGKMMVSMWLIIQEVRSFNVFFFEKKERKPVSKLGQERQRGF